MTTGAILIASGRVPNMEMIFFILFPGDDGCFLQQLIFLA
jgi:hypothetical protein